MKNIIKYIESTYIYKHKKAELFILFELFLIFMIYIIFFVIFPEESINTSMATFSSKNILKLRKTRRIHSWNSIEFKIKNLIFTKDLFNSKFNLFWEKVSQEFTNNNHMFILFKIKYQGSDYSTIGNLQRLNKNDKNWYLNWIINNMEFKSEYYNETAIESIIFSYGFKDGKTSNKELINSNVNFQYYKNSKLIISFNPLDYGNLVSKIEIENYTQFILQNNDNLLININQFENYNEVSLILRGNTIIKFKDEFISDNKFVRTIDNKKFYFENNKEILFTKETKTKFISQLKTTKNLKNNFITLDIETYIKDSILIVYCISIFDGNSIKTFFLNNFKNSEELIITALKSIMIRKYNKTNVYVHNLAKFDIIFLLKYLVKLGSVKPIIHNDRIICINFSFGKNNEYQIQFRDSLLLLLRSLNTLCKSFKVNNAKTIFPLFFVNENNLDYIGEVPKFKYFGKINIGDFNEYISKFNNNWNLKKEAIKYCNLDCISLYQILSKFNDMIFSLFGKNIHHYPTLPSLAFAIYRSNFMEEENIPQLSGKIDEDIRQGYTGGSCDMYIPKSIPGVKIKCLDVNSLYPSRMEEMEMPIGKPVYFEGDITLFKNNPFGIFEVEVQAPDNLNVPILQLRHKTNSNNIRTISPIGTWTGVYFSEEISNALKYGYTFKVLRGYLFEKDYIFIKYVDFLYDLKVNSQPGSPDYIIAKLLLNSLYGRLGMSPEKEIHKIVSNKQSIALINKYEINNIIDFKNGKQLISFFDDSSGDTRNKKSSLNISIPISTAVTAWARVHMSQFKNNPEYNLYYTDTDSIDIDSPLNEVFIGKELGKMKLEHIFKEAIFLAPKVYGGKTETYEYLRVKGAKNQICFSELKPLLGKDNKLEIPQQKWYKNMAEGNIKIKDELYSLKITDNKRQLIYDKNNKFVDTKPLILNEGHIEVLDQMYTLKVTDNKRRLIYQDGKLIGSQPYIINENKEILNK